VAHNILELYKAGQSSELFRYLDDLDLPQMTRLMQNAQVKEILFQPEIREYFIHRLSLEFHQIQFIESVFFEKQIPLAEYLAPQGISAQRLWQIGQKAIFAKDKILLLLAKKYLVFHFSPLTFCNIKEKDCLEHGSWAMYDCDEKTFAKVEKTKLHILLNAGEKLVIQQLTQSDFARIKTISAKTKNGKMITILFKDNLNTLTLSQSFHENLIFTIQQTYSNSAEHRIAISEIKTFPRDNPQNPYYPVFAILKQLQLSSLKK
jgi:hypothetical protein